MATSTKVSEETRAVFREKCVALTVDTILMCRQIHNDSTMWPLIDQVVRSAGSIGANVIEGQAASSRKDFTNFMRIAYKSSQETLYWFTVMMRTCPNHVSRIRELSVRAEELGRVLAASLRTLQSR